MTIEKINEYLQSFTCRHAKLLEQLNVKWSTGVCAEEAHCQNIIITNYMDVLKRIELIVGTLNIVRFFSSEYPPCFPPYGINYSFSINDDDYSFDLSCSDNALEVIANALNTEGKYIATYGIDSESNWFLDIQLPVNEEVTSTDVLITFYVEDETLQPRTLVRQEDVLSLSCLTDDEICAIICRLNELLENCGCNG
jgi:hypothetical protein